MKENYKIAIVGNKDTIMGFKALGLKTFDANNTEEAIKVLKKLVSEQSEGSKEEAQSAYAIIFLMEEFASTIPADEYKKLNQNALPAIIPIPSSKGTNGYGIRRIGKMVEQAVGSDIFKE